MPAAAEPDNAVHSVEKEANSPTTTAREAPAPRQSPETPDDILNKAKIAVAAKIENPASAKFGDMKRATRKDTFGQPADTICGYVKSKKASGEEAEERPFLYLVKEDRAYIDDGYPDSVAATTYRAICGGAAGENLRRQ
ncbi:MAG TPA: hypothetical protein VEC94_15200 [Pseudolabrys sp.]|nr:hypothetical protein [Pseudolabrys sp.]